MDMMQALGLYRSGERKPVGMGLICEANRALSNDLEADLTQRGSAVLAS